MMEIDKHRLDTDQIIQKMGLAKGEIARLKMEKEDMQDKIDLLEAKAKVTFLINLSFIEIRPVVKELRTGHH